MDERKISADPAGVRGLALFVTITSITTVVSVVLLLSVHFLFCYRQPTVPGN